MQGKPLSDSKVLIIWGMHRSGTSLLASWLHACGLNVGSELLGEAIGNKLGHYEDMEFLRLHDSILNANGITCGGLLNTSPLQVSLEMQQEVRELLVRKCKSAQWGWKDPRTCLFSREYLELLPHARHLVVYRDYELVVDSLIRRRLKNRAHRARLKNKSYDLRTALWRRFLMPKVVNRYLAAWVHYNENLLKLADSVTADSLVVMNCRDFVSASTHTFSRLQQWGFNLEHQPAKNYVDSSMIASKPSRNFRFDPILKARADAVSERLTALARASAQREHSSVGL